MTSGQELLAALEQASRGIHDPVAKLRFIRGSLARSQDWDRTIQAVPGAPLRRWLYRRLSLERLRTQLSSNPLGTRSPSPAALLDARTRRALAWNRPIAAIG